MKPENSENDVWTLRVNDLQKKNSPKGRRAKRGTPSANLLCLPPRMKSQYFVDLPNHVFQQPACLSFSRLAQDLFSKLTGCIKSRLCIKQVTSNCQTVTSLRHGSLAARETGRGKGVRMFGGCTSFLEPLRGITRPFCAWGLEVDSHLR